VRLTRHRARVVQLGRRRCRTRVKAVDPELGFNDNAVRAGRLSAKADARLTEGVGAGIHRLTFDWRYAEPRKDDYHFEIYDDIYQAMIARGIRPLFVVMYAPSWAWDLFVGCRGDCRYPPSRNRYAEWAEILGIIARRYPHAAGIEVWNEPNSPRFWAPQLDPRRYADLVIEAHRAVKAVDQRMPVISAGLVSGDGSRGEMPLEDFLSALYGYGLRDAVDGIGMHTYPRNGGFPEVSFGLATVRAVQAAFGDSATPIWITEVGFSTAGSDPLLTVSEADQKKRLIEIYRGLGREPGVRSVIIHSLIDPATGLGLDAGYGLIRADGSPKPAYCALATELRTGTKCP
jgi:polysaccharide biosynthesis protein PslG